MPRTRSSTAASSQFPPPRGACTRENRTSRTSTSADTFEARTWAGAKAAPKESPQHTATAKRIEVFTEDIQDIERPKISPGPALCKQNLRDSPQGLRPICNLATSPLLRHRERVNVELPHKLSVLVFLRDSRGRHLLIERARAPNRGCWSPIGGKVETRYGESPHECAARETFEEAGLRAAPEDFHLFAMIAERAYEGGGHWLMFLFECRRPIDTLPAPIDEGRFGFFSREEIDTLTLPETDRSALWPIYDHHRDGFVAMRADCTPGRDLVVHIEERLPGPTPSA
ncbi:MAG: NUDIX hydrolase [Verrucomicrobia bacterium]|nr:MAG: NUDIX hydrolase [Verrucomicrobiota bacterium]